MLEVVQQDPFLCGRQQWTLSGGSIAAAFMKRTIAKCSMYHRKDCRAYRYSYRYYNHRPVWSLNILEVFDMKAQRRQKIIQLIYSGLTQTGGENQGTLEQSQYAYQPLFSCTVKKSQGRDLLMEIRLSGGELHSGIRYPCSLEERVPSPVLIQREEALSHAESY